MDSERPRKRPKIEDRHLDYSTISCQQLVLEEIDVELGLRQRLAETIHSRLTWALLLQEAFEKNYGRVHTVESTAYEDAALDALKVLEKPCILLLDQDLTLFEKPVPLLTQTDLAAVAPTPTSNVSINLQNLSRTTSSRIRGLPRALPLPAKKLLFLRDKTNNPPAIAKLACPDCSRTDFSSLQGLLNHCRLRHQREYGSHDECIQSCAVLVPDEERDFVVANGTELGGISLPSLKRLFEIAVGAGDRVVIPSVSRMQSEPKVTTENAKQSSAPRDNTPESTHITRTLGYHIDTPALAPFLGRTPKKRVINVHINDDEQVDVLSMDDNDTMRVWRKSYNQRNVARPELDEVPSVAADDVSPEAYKQEDAVLPSNTPVRQLPSVGNSRFHIVARVKVADHSLWLPSDRRPALHPDHTHRWRLSVSSPSYSFHITTFLAKLTITCLTDPPPSVLLDPIVITEPPFVFIGTTDKPFLARLTFTWVGNQNAPMDIEHWVDLYPLRVPHPILGDEQVFDVELDRNTELLPIREDQGKITWMEEQPDVGSDHKGHDKLLEEMAGMTTDADRGYVKILRALVQQIPITTKDARGRAQGASTLMLVPTATQFRNLVLGRRKAIEMNRARALREAYEDHIAALPDKDRWPSLGTTEVYRWMVDENIFPRPVVKTQTAVAEKQEDLNTQQSPNSDAYCRSCGLHERLHPDVVKSENASTDQDGFVLRDRTATSACLTFDSGSTGLPWFDVHHLQDRNNPRISPGCDTPYNLSPALFKTPTTPPRRSLKSADLVAVAHPQMVTAVWSLSMRWGLEHFQVSADSPNSAADLMARSGMSWSRAAVEDHLAPYALLATVAQSMIGLLVRSGMDAAKQDELVLRGLGRQSTRRKAAGAQEVSGARRLLTPSHILRGLWARAPGGLAESATLLAMSGLGAGKDSTATFGPDGGDGSEAVVVKVEEHETAVSTPDGQ